MRIVALIVLLMLSSLSQAASSPFSQRRSIDDHVSYAPSVLLSGKEHADTSGLTAGTYAQAIEHSAQQQDALAGQTFKQRYWINSDYASGPDAPVLYHICGESDATQGYFLQDNAIPWAKALGARIVYLEHRFYGESLPYPDLTTEHLQNFTLDNILEDLASFQKWISATQGWTGKWISIGGSYSGTLSAIYRQTHPELVVGALATSAPMISGVGSFLDDIDSIADLTSTDPSSDTGSRQWAYQACATFVFWYADGYDINSNLQSPSRHLCQRIFGDAVPAADSIVYNQKYNQPFLTDSPTAPSNILFTYGSEDVWTKLGLVQQSNHNSKISIRVIEGAGHHFDLNAPDFDDSAAVLAARNEFLNLAKRWLGR